MRAGIKITGVKYVDGYKIEITFSDGKVNIFDYHDLIMREHEESIPYKDIESFKKFKIIGGTEIAWGKDWDMILPLHTIYSKTKFSTTEILKNDKRNRKYAIKVGLLPKD